MRSFLIRDILSGPASGAGTASDHQAASSCDQPEASPFDCAQAAQSLAASQARFLAKLAEHQQQIQANKYYEQLQQQHNQLLNLNLNHHHLQQLQLQQQQQQQHHHQQQRQLVSLGSKVPPPKELAQGGSSGSGRLLPSSVANSSNSLQANKQPRASSFAYDCASPISSISDVEATNDEDEEEEEEDDGDGEEDRRRRQINGVVDDEEEEDEEEDDEEEIEVERVTGSEEETASGSRRAKRWQFMKGLQRQVETKESGEQMREQLIGNKHEQFQLNSPLDALFQMTSNTFDVLKRGEKRKDREPDHQGSTNFTSKQSSKKKRKSRTAFTNNQIYELERRFRMQKYLSPTDRDEIAMTLNLSNAQVITWFQNRRAKLKRDLEEQKRDIETASLLNLHKTFLESFQALSSQMKTAIKTPEAICRTGGPGLHE